MTGIVATVIAIVFVLLVSGHVTSKHTAPPSCQDVSQYMSPCIPFLQNRNPKPAKDCCRGVKRLRKHAKKQEDRSAICQCLESLAPLAGPVDLSLISGLPKQCKVKLQLPQITSLNFNCSLA